VHLDYTFKYYSDCVKVSLSKKYIQLAVNATLQPGYFRVCKVVELQVINIQTVAFIAFVHINSYK